MVPGSSVLVGPGAVEVITIPQLVTAPPSSHIHGASVQIGITRASDGKWFDFSGNTFTATPAMGSAVMAEVSLNGTPTAAYSYTWDTSAITNAAANDVYTLIMSVDPSTSAIPSTFIGEIRTWSPLLNATASAIWNAVLTSYATLGQATVAGGALYALKIAALNKAVETPGNPGTLVLYKDDSVTPFATMQLTDANSNAVTAAAGDPAQRSAAS